MQNHITPRLSAKEFDALRQRFQVVTGIALADHKKMLVTGRLSKRLKYYQLSSFSQYLELLNEPANEAERQLMVDLLTTNETYFFREPNHFEYLKEQVLSEYRLKANHFKPFRVWSAACSSGEEAYSLSMLLMDILGSNIQWEIFASDVSLSMLEIAKTRYYPMVAARKMPQKYLKRFCLKGVRSQEGTLLVKPEVAERVHFRQINLNQPLPVIGSFDLIFLRNILIYYDVPARTRILKRLLPVLQEQGYLFLGHAESLTGMTDAYILKNLHPMVPTVFRKC
ncbi:CheR family methyltransferase [Candidatus Venteria ishoeyi]|uniref:CheR family methyltransferase n=1 Tax=Candidatus Venteria ishoeyi TaxID=1899563 RepID=UPI0015ADEDB8|nr:CheR family methyltransferase [Candidatus Venteria ishoeyi]MDM8545942.1 CheR family methyltransferase [Candidatus Venteria ishoeyi]